MNRSTRIVTPILILILQACNSTSTPALTPTLFPASVTAPALTLTPLPVTSTPSVTSAPVVSPTPTLALQPVYVSARDQPVNCRFGPGIVFEVVSGLTARQTAQAIGKSFDNLWWYVADPNIPGGTCWVFSAAVDLQGQTDSLPVAGAPAVTVDKLEVSVEPARISVACNAFPQFVLITGQITANGPTLAAWHWELSTGEVSADTQMVFEQAGTQSVQKSLVVASPNDYWVELHVTAPNTTFQRAIFVANCTS